MNVEARNRFIKSVSTDTEMEKLIQFRGEELEKV